MPSEQSTICEVRRDPRNPELRVSLSGPEYHVLGSPRRKRKVWAVRLGIRKDGVAAGGFCWKSTEAEARELFDRQTTITADPRFGGCTRE